MPCSWPSQISPLLNIILAASPRSILDIGCGYGTYVVLCRQYLDVTKGVGPDTRYPPPRRVTIDGIEACPDYISPIHNYVYDKVYPGDALDVLPTLRGGSYDLALVIDVLEHFRSGDASEFMDEVLRVARVALLATPTTEMPQGATFGNNYEQHRSSWSPRSLRKLAPAVRFFSSLTTSTGHVCLLSSDPAALAPICRQAWVLRWVSFRTVLLERIHLREPLRRLFRRGASLGASCTAQPHDSERT
jgi:SAM-dependent methyltransferase